MAILTCVRYLIVVLIFISLVISDAEHLFTCLLVIYVSSFGHCLLILRSWQLWGRVHRLFPHMPPCLASTSILHWFVPL